MSRMGIMVNCKICVLPLLSALLEPLLNLIMDVLFSMGL